MPETVELAVLLSGGDVMRVMGRIEHDEGALPASLGRGRTRNRLLALTVIAAIAASAGVVQAFQARTASPVPPTSGYATP